MGLPKTGTNIILGLHSLSMSYGSYDLYSLISRVEWEATITIQLISIPYANLADQDMLISLTWQKYYLMVEDARFLPIYGHYQICIHVSLPETENNLINKFTRDG